MRSNTIVFFQLGKQGLKGGFIELLATTFKKHDLVKLSILKSCTRDRQEVKEIADRLCAELESREKKNFTAKIVGFTMFLKKWRKRIETKK
jgi:RNA-binding protein YhbY